MGDAAINIVLANMFLIVKIAGGLFLLKMILNVLGYSRYAQFLEMLAYGSIALMMVSTVGKLMNVAATISSGGAWPQ